MRSTLVLVAALALLLAHASQTAATIVFSETFSYTDGPITTNSSGAWTTHSGTSGQVDVTSGRVNLSAIENEDVNRAYVAVASGTLFAGFDITLTELPGAPAGSYVAHFKDSGVSNFKGRVHVGTLNAASGMYRLAVSANGTSTQIPVDLALNATHRVVLALNVATTASTLYLNSPTQVGGTAATDTGSPISISSFALRQANGIGVMSLDNLIVATTYAEAYTVAAVPEVPASALVAVAASGAAAPMVLRRQLRARS